jgi:hypothetical protein
MSGSPVADEAAKLVEAVQEWLSGAAGPSVHVAGNDADCAFCPVCQLIRASRSIRPEVFDHLAGGANEIMAALRAAIDDPEHSAHARRTTGLQHIDIGD